MIDFKNKLKGKEIPKRTNPIEIYDSLDRRSETGPLRPSQRKILESWYVNKSKDRDNIIKLHTGEGKTLIGLLILQSKINSSNQSCLYVCPNKYLAKQVMEDASKFGIPYCVIDDSNRLPDDFLSAQKILVTHVQKLFNGRTIFGTGTKSTPVNSIVIDDSQACIDSIKNSFTIRVDKNHALYKSMVNIFSDDLRAQGEGSFLEIEQGMGRNTLLPIPYWAWIDKKEQVSLEIIKNSEDKAVLYVWPIIKDEIHNCQAFISGEYLEISPVVSFVEKFGTFSSAQHRFLMSATTQDDSFFIKGLSFDINAVKKPLVNEDLLWSGEKMILIPSLIDESLDREKIIHWALKEWDSRMFGRVCLAPSFANKSQYERIGAVVAKSETIFNNVDRLKKSDFTKAIVFANRYDGIDLPDNACRLLIIDSKPYSETLTERYEEDCRPSSDVINVKIAQKVEQGLGRSVRGEKDYSAIVIVGGDLVQFIKSPLTKNYFSDQTQMQIEIGSKIVGFAKEEIEDGGSADKIFLDLINKCLKRDEGWKEYYSQSMDGINQSVKKDKLYDLISLEKKAEDFYLKNDAERACIVIQDICDNYVDNEMEKGWYLQLQARYKYFISKVESNRLQKSAFQVNRYLLKPKDGVAYRKIGEINASRTKRIIDWIGCHKDYEAMMIHLDGILQNLNLGVHSEKFEEAVNELGLSLGFDCQRPDKEIRKGPDNLWGGVDGQYILIECKNEVDENRKEINKHEAGQMNSHCAWFKDVYNTDKCKKIMIINTKVLSYHGDFYEDVEVMRFSKLRSLKNNVRDFYKELKNYDIHSLTDDKIQGFLISHDLEIKNITSNYSEKVVKANK